MPAIEPNMPALLALMCLRLVLPRCARRAGSSVAQNGVMHDVRGVREMGRKRKKVRALAPCTHPAAHPACQLAYPKGCHATRTLLHAVQNGASFLWVA